MVECLKNKKMEANFVKAVISGSIVFQEEY